jgi:LemA protein
MDVLLSGRILMVILAVVLVLVVVLAVWAVAIYNGLVGFSNQIRNAFSQIDVQLQRRYDLIPNLVETAKGYMKFERETLEAVIAARNVAQTAAKKAAADPNAAAVRELQGAESALGGLLTKFFALSEAYPDLKASQNMMQLQEELASTENRIAFARQAYNDAVMNYNIKRESFPNSIVASSFGFKAAEQWVSETPDAVRQNVKVSFS